jgi:hypothetical protein
LLRWLAHNVASGRQSWALEPLACRFLLLCPPFLPEP